MNDSLMNNPFMGEGTYRHQRQQDVQPSKREHEMHMINSGEDPDEGPQRKQPTTCIGRLVPHGGSLSGMVNLASATLGASIISLPFAFRDSGVAVAIVIVTMIAAATVFAIHLLVEAGERTGCRSYEEMAQHLIGKGSQYVVAFLMWFFCFGTCVAYVIALGDVVLPFVRGQGTGFWYDEWGVHAITAIIWFCVMLPLSLPKEINSLRYFSLIAVTLILFFVVVMIYHAGRYGFNTDHVEALQSFRGGVRALDGLSLFMFAFLCQINCFEVYFEMHPRSVERMTRDTSISMSICCLLYVIAGFFGYLDFLDNTEDAILKNYNPRSDIIVAISFIGIAFKLCVGFSLCIQPARDAVFAAFGVGDYRTVPTYRRIALCSTMSVCALVLGILIPKINIVFGFLGSLIGGLVGFALPAIFSMKARDDWSKETVGTTKFYCTWALLISGVVSFVVGTAASVLDLIGIQ